MVFLNSSSTKSLNFSLSCTFGKHRRHRCILVDLRHNRLSREFNWRSDPSFLSTDAIWPCLAVAYLNNSLEVVSEETSIGNVTASNSLSGFDSVSSATQFPSGRTVLFSLLWHSGWRVLMLWRLSKKTFFSLFNLLAKDCSSFFPFPLPGMQRNGKNYVKKPWNNDTNKLFKKPKFMLK